MNVVKTRSHTRLAAAAVLALGLATASPVMADPGNGNGHGNANGHSAEQSAPGQSAPETAPAAPAPAPAAPAADSGNGNQGNDNGKGESAKPEPAKPAPAKPAKPAPAKPAPAPAKPAKPAPAKPAPAPAKPAKPAPAKGDPAGNNGTVKIAPYGDVDRIPNNTPHVGCTFQVEWFGFDQGAVSQVTFAEHAPTTGVGMTVSGDSLTVDVGHDAASGAGTSTGFDQVARYSLSFTEPGHAKQGYHVKLTINTTGSQGADVKHKVFWVEGCGPVAPTTPPAENPGSPIVSNPGTPVVVEAPEAPLAGPVAPVVAGTTAVVPGSTTTSAAPQVLGEEAATGAEVTTVDTSSTSESAAAEAAAAADAEVLGAQATNDAPGVQLPTAIDAGANALGIQSPAERSVFGLLLMLLGAAFARFAWTRRARA
ncbi:hypothetical protein [Nocardioides piscis]|uniref:Uncharacterized protein n=1 Tax=Nocardioides piscis TaxID=2714938 RepID=A0A6G7YB78_9ACTN|nr:hypothetical protein [Nocardioides piscis]QIK74055.1 hypothetical protein G7071_05360 [Nocardioides piscis]